LLNEAIVAAISRATNCQPTIASCKHRIINNDGGGWCVRCDEMWGEGIRTDDWWWRVKQNTATDRVANSSDRNIANLNHEWNAAFSHPWDY